MKKISYILIPVGAFLTAYFGSIVTNSGMSWYRTLILPSFTPEGYIIGIVWTVIFILSAFSAVHAYNSDEAEEHDRVAIASAFIINAFLNVFWSVLFFAWHYIGYAVIEAGILALSVLGIMIIVWKISKLSVILLIPYLLWVTFATYLTYTIYQLN